MRLGIAVFRFLPDGEGLKGCTMTNIKALAHIVPDKTYPGMWRVVRPDGRGAHYFADRCRRLRNDIGDLPIRARALRVQPPDCDELDFAAAESPPSSFQAFHLKPSPAFGSLLLQLSFLPHGQRARKLASVTSSHVPERRLNVRFTSKRHALHL